MPDQYNKTFGLRAGCYNPKLSATDKTLTNHLVVNRISILLTNNSFYRSRIFSFLSCLFRNNFRGVKRVNFLAKTPLSISQKSNFANFFIRLYYSIPIKPRGPKWLNKNTNLKHFEQQALMALLLSAYMVTHTNFGPTISKILDTKFNFYH